MSVLKKCIMCIKDTTHFWLGVRIMKIGIVYATMTGNTEEIAKILEDELKKANLEVKTLHMEFDDVMALDLKDYDAVLFGTYTWGDADLPFEVEDFHDDLVDEDLTGKVVGLFGSCDSYYPIYGAAMEIMAKQFKAVGATVMNPLLKIELAPEPEDKEKIASFVDTFLEQI